MPQFDFSTFLGQIFWLLICFSALYFCVSRIILPRIAEIISRRNILVDEDLQSAKSLQAEIDKLNKLSEEIRSKSNSSYKQSIEKSVNKCLKDREDSLKSLKSEIANMASDSAQKMSDLVSKSRSDYSKFSSEVASTIVKKIFGNQEDFKGEIKFPAD